VKASMAMWTGCVGGALEEQEFLALLRDTGFESPSIEPTRVYTRDDAVALLAGTGLEERFADEMEGRIMSGFVRATKPGATAPRIATAARRLAVTETTPETSTSTRACGCDDGCCT
jgi:arsenite methyltransferase